MNRKPALLWRLAFFSLAAFLFSAIPTQLVERDTLCIIYHFSGYECPMCGMTRAFSNAMHFAFSRAVSFNFFISALFPLFWFLFLDDLLALLSLMRKKGYRSHLERIWAYIENRSLR